MKRIVVIALSILFAPPLAGGHMTEKGINRNRSKAQDEIRELERRRLQAMVEVDTKTLDRILAEDMTYSHTSGRVDTKATFIEALRSGSLKYESVDTQDVQVRVYGAAAVVTGQGALKVKSGGQESSFQIRYLDVYVKQKNGWQMVAWQSTRLAQ